ncbi:MAG TPA: TonB-dependent receptor [Gemmatimonadales bacterium]|nr:TonB-dependent receptor [Gemmatimonadales bacterium]
MRGPLLAGLILLAAAAPLRAQSNGAIAGVVRDAQTGVPLANVLVSVEDGRRGALSDSAGRYRIREIRSGLHTLHAALIGYTPLTHDSLQVRSGGTTVLDLALQPSAVPIETINVQAAADPVLDPLATATEQKVTGEELRRLPVTSVQEAISLSAGAVGESYRGGRLGQESFVLDGMGLKNQLDASSNSLGIRIPTSMVTEASLTTNAFSARYGQALSGVVNVVTRDGGNVWHAQAAYESDRLFTGNADYGLDRLLLQADGPLFAGITFIGVVDATGRLDADPVSAPPPTDPLDPRSSAVAMLPHNSGEQYDIGGKLAIPIGRKQTLRLFGLYGAQQGLLYDQLFKYDLGFAPAQRITGGLVTADYQYASAPDAGTPLVLDVRAGWYGKTFHRGELLEEPDQKYGAFTGTTFHFRGEDIAEALDTAAANGPVPGFGYPEYSTATPWGVPAFFLTGGSRGEIAFNNFEEVRTQIDATIGVGHSSDLYLGAQYLAQQVQTFQRTDAWAPVGGDVPPATASDFNPHAGSLYAEAQARLSDLAFTGGVRYDFFDPGADLNNDELGARGSLNPRFAVSTVLSGATLVASYGKFSMPPDLQFLVDATFDDSTRTGRYRRGNPNLGFETSTQYEFSLRLRPQANIGLRLGAYYKRLDGLVSSIPLGVNPDSSIFGNSDYGSVKGLEILATRPVINGWGLQVSYVLQSATATSTNPFLRLQLPTIDPGTGDTIYPGRVEYPLDYDRRHALTAVFQSQLSRSAGPTVLGGHPMGALETAVVLRYASGLPYTLTNTAGDTLLSDVNGLRLPSYTTFDLLIRKPIPFGSNFASVYLDIRNFFNVSTVQYVRQDTGTPQIDEDMLQAQAQAAYDAHPESIPFESPRYRPYADLDGNGLIEGASELMPMYERAARDYNTPVFQYGQPRLFRLGFEVMF